MLTVLALLGRLRAHHVVALLALAAVSIIVGAGLFAVTQDVSFATAMYGAITTATTVGYGDVLPRTRSAVWLRWV